MARGVSTRVGLYFGLMQLLFALSWIVYVLYLPQLAGHAGINRAAVPWILVLDQAIFALCDWLTGVAADRVAIVVGRLGTLVAAFTAVSTLAFLLLPLVTGLGAAAFLTLVVIWSITSSALRAPPLKLLGRYTPPDQQPWVGALYLLGIGIASALAPFLAGWIAAYDPRAAFALSAGSILVVTLSIVWAERTLAGSAPPEAAGGTKVPSATVLWFLVAVLLLAIGFQVHSFIDTQPLAVRVARPPDDLLWLFWIGFSLLMLPASSLTKRFGGILVMALGALVGAGSAWAAAEATNAVSLGIAQFICGGAWGVAMMSAVTAAFAIGHPGSEGTAVGAMLSLMAVAAMARIVLVAAHFDHVRAIALALPWLPIFSWLAAGLMLLAAARRPSQPA